MIYSPEIQDLPAKPTARIHKPSRGNPSDKHETAKQLKAKYTQRRGALELFIKRVTANGGVADEADEIQMRALGFTQEELDRIVEELRG